MKIIKTIKKEIIFTTVLISYDYQTKEVLNRNESSKIRKDRKIGFGHHTDPLGKQKGIKTSFSRQKMQLHNNTKLQRDGTHTRVPKKEKSKQQERNLKYKWREFSPEVSRTQVYIEMKYLRNLTRDELHIKTHLRLTAGLQLKNKNPGSAVEDLLGSM